MLSRIHGDIFMECDGKNCTETLETETKNLEEARQIFNEANWKSRNVRGAWFDICPICLEAETKDAFQ